MQVRFLGASVRSVQASLAWGEQGSGGLNLQLVEDVRYGDDFQPEYWPQGGVGTPVGFILGAFTYFGLLRSWQRENSTAGLPTYSVTVMDASEILQSAHVILGSYNGPTTTVPNLYNVYGWWEASLGFGGARTSQSGMPWNLVRTALQQMTIQGHAFFGGPLQYRGYTYALDLSEVPLAPPYYKVGPDNAGLWDIISQVCTDCGLDFFVELVPTFPIWTVKVRTVSRYNQPPLGTISALASSALYSGLVSSSNSGVELRTGEITSAFVVGGNVQVLVNVPAELINSYWGLDFFGQPITGYQHDWPIIGQWPTANLNASSISDIIGGVIYPCSILEMLCAVTSPEMWEFYIAKVRPDLAILLKSVLVGVPPPANPRLPLDFGLEGNKQQQEIADGLAIEDTLQRFKDVHNFVKQYAEDYLGKWYVLGVPFALFASVDPDTLKLNYNYQPIDGGWVEEGLGIETPLGIEPLNTDRFKNQDGTYRSFALFTDLGNVDLSKVSIDKFAIQNNGVYITAEVKKQMVIIDGVPAVVVELTDGVQERKIDGIGNINEVARLAGIPAGDIENLVKNQFAGNLLFEIEPTFKSPAAIAVPLICNTITYGPWYLAGALGKVKYEQVPDLVPWNYGGYTIMNAVGASKVLESATFMEVVETGSLEVIDVPRAKLGDVMQLNGPNLTSIQISYGTDGIKTNHQFGTYTPPQRGGVFTKNHAERLKQFSTNLMEQRKNIKQALRETALKQGELDRAIAGRRWIDKELKILKKDSPHELLVAGAIEDETNPDLRRVGGTTSTIDEAVRGLRAKDNTPAGYQSRAVMGITGLLRPFSTAYANNGYISNFKQPSYTTGITVESLNPLQAGNDIELYSNGNTATDLNTRRNPADPNNSRALALRGPLIVSGWGYTIDGKPVPGNIEQNNFLDGTLKKSHLWPTGPVDMLWDSGRSVWTSHDLYIGTINAELPASGSQVMKIWNQDGETGQEVTVYNFFSSPVTVPSGGTKKIMAGYIASTNKLYVIAADCVP